MDNFMHSKKLLWVFAVIGGLAVLVMLVALVWLKQQDSGTDVKPAELKLEKQDVPTTRLPDKLPADIPQEPGAKVTQNYTATTNDGRLQSTRVFETAKTLDENVKIYTDYLKKNGWTIGAGADLKDVKAISASKGDLALQITIAQNNVNQIKTVNISLTQAAPVVQ